MEQGTPKPEPKEQAPPSPVEQMLQQVLNNQGVIVENQQMILDAIAGTQNLIRKLAGAEEPEQEEEQQEEVEEEEEAPPAPPKKKIVQMVKKKGK
jgi:hypothetical protein